MALEDAKNPMQGVSGPGKFAKRTDLQFQPEQYGQGVEMAALKAGAPLAQAQPTPKATPTQVRQAASSGQGAGLYDETQYPDRPVTHGADVGPGAGSEALMMNQIKQNDQDIIAKYLPSMMALASAQDTPESFRAFVSYLQGSL